ncbi:MULTISPECIES: WecB/TagA/CpsF family glycosyltransferase [Enterococcus]|uniref:N-acetylglucosaminyldiphosphoundecaprenol N-acetyl-beta-D-mannosaminyltransferase n=1 Tax=Candidatus Enterococcus mangumiae TaxID=2230878 RepID=A0ABZ2SW99_9ENTE|nr:MULTISPECIES: WecB/TagA/CpsF family glycosyltransferase [unclassified Enterococcus]MBO0460922.1 WecB/TagA/CpsF family glycosyltransferase [Enterococcus sp. DIV1298c]MBO0488944.1 WecB/TagA/CpsF family glycosyltransferase [Enterococcus sp. DIV1094]MBO1298680.1 WecB/TagA/CpsF family glycosyltransferase [Enterococcus sp. DIV1271a]
MNRQRRIEILGSKLDPLTFVETVSAVEEMIEQGIHAQHVSINAGKINLMHADPELQKIVNRAALITADGQSIVWAAHYLGYDVPERVTGIDLFRELVKLSAEKGWRPYYLGATEEVVASVVAHDQKKYPDLTIAGYHHGYFSHEESPKIAQKIANAKPDLLFVAFSSPQKEIWLETFREVLQVPFAMGVGGSFDIVAGKTKRAPLWMQKTGLEWFYRFIQEPIRMFDRYIKGNLRFLRTVWREKRTNA